MEKYEKPKVFKGFWKKKIEKYEKPGFSKVFGGKV